MASLLTERVRSEKWLPQPRQVACNEEGSIGYGCGTTRSGGGPTPEEAAVGAGAGGGVTYEDGMSPLDRFLPWQRQAQTQGSRLCTHSKHMPLLVRMEAQKRRSETRAVLVECCKGKLPDPAVEVVLDSLLGSVPLEGA